MTDSVRPKLTILEANSLISALRELEKFGGIVEISESHLETAKQFADRLELMLAYWQARQTVKKIQER